MLNMCRQFLKFPLGFCEHKWQSFAVAAHCEQRKQMMRSTRNAEVPELMDVEGDCGDFENPLQTRARCCGENADRKEHLCRFGSGT